MPTTTPLTDAINALTTYSNTVTGASDQTLSDAVATLAAGYGGGGGGALQLIDTITVTEQTNYVDIDLTQYYSYDIVIIVVDCELTASEWLYVNPNVSVPTTTAHTWVGPSTTFKTSLAQIQNTEYGRVLLRFPKDVLPPTSTGAVNLMVNTYNASNNFKVNSTFRIYGCNYSDM